MGVDERIGKAGGGAKMEFGSTRMGEGREGF